MKIRSITRSGLARRVRRGSVLAVASAACLLATLVITDAEAVALAPPATCTFEVGDTDTTVTWESVAGAIDYKITRKIVQQPWDWSIPVVLDPGQELTLTNLSSDNVIYRVRARAGADKSSSTTCQELAPPPTCTIEHGDVGTTIRWEPGIGANEYVVSNKLPGKTWQWYGKVTAPTTELTKNNKPGEYRVLSKSANGTKSSFTTCSYDTNNNGTEIVGQWVFNDDTVTVPGGVVTVTDTAANADAIGGMPSYPSTVTWDQTDEALAFNGGLGSVMLADVSGTPDIFNPSGATLRWIVDFSIPQTTIDGIHDAVATDPEVTYGKVSLNLMQRGYGANDGGQWKTQIVFKQANGVNFAIPQCTVRENKDDGHTRIKTEKANELELTPGERYTIACEYNAESQALVATLYDADDMVTTVSTTSTELDDVSPGRFDSAKGCDVTPNKNRLGDTIAFGNKPECNTGQTAVDIVDRFAGTVYRAEVQTAD